MPSIETAAAELVARAARGTTITYECDACGYSAAFDNAAEIGQLIEHTQYDHVARAGIVAIKAPLPVWSANEVAMKIGGEFAPCGIVNGTYGCQRASGHDGMHVASYVGATFAFADRWGIVRRANGAERATIGR